MASLRLFILCLLLPAPLSVMAADGAKIATAEFTFNLPDGWRQTASPGALIAAVPIDNDGRYFAVGVDAVWGCPTPCEISEQSGYEKGYWQGFDRNFETSAHCTITSSDFRMIDGIPFRIFDAIREGQPGTEEKFHYEVALTSGNGNLYALLFLRKGAPPEDDPDLQALMGSFAFLKPPLHPWYQPLIRESDNITGAPLFFVALGMGIYLLIILKKADVPATRKINIGAIAFCLCAINSYWIAGLNSIAGIASLFLFAALILLLKPLIKERRALIAQGKVVGPAPKQLKTRFWILVGSVLLGVAIADVQMFYAGLSAPFMMIVNAATIVTFGLVFWIQRHNFFPKSDSGAKPKP
jgi:hypothetical protein